MAHELDIINGKASMAYMGETPWHGLGTRLQPGMTIPEWRTAAGLDYTVESATVQYQDSTDNPRFYDTKRVLYRSDTGKPLSVVGNGYKVVQPEQVMDFFESLTKNSGFEMETAGVLFEGKRIWALARAGESKFVGRDEIRPYVLLATSFDTSMATTARFTSVRVVCNNTLTMAQSSGVDKYGLSVHHGKVFNNTKAILSLGVQDSKFGEFITSLSTLADKQLHEEEAYEMTKALVQPKGKPAGDRTFSKIMALFNGGAIGYDQSGGNTAYTWLNAVTETVDHHRTAGVAMFGAGEILKNRALELVSQG